MPVSSSGHDTGANIYDDIVGDSPVHQHITRESGNVLSYLPSELEFHLAAPINAPIDVPCFANYDQGYDDIVTCSADEDQEWVPILGCLLGPRYTNGYLEHFWDHMNQILEVALLMIKAIVIKSYEIYMVFGSLRVLTVRHKIYRIQRLFATIWER